eukprot:m51a1_g14272 putative protein tyrosine phosphatase (167) ;mRNA; f:343457-344306
MAQHTVNPASVVEYRSLRFVIFDAPNDENLPLYIKELQKQGVRTVVRACDPTYDKETMSKAGITVHDLSFADGAPPPDAVVQRWMQIVTSTFDGKKPPSEAIGVHCVAGLGRAPILVAIALIEHGLKPLEAVEFIRSKRRGALNVTQLQYIKTYKARYLKKECAIM